MEHVRKLSALGVESVETSGSSHSGDTGMEGLELENDGNSGSSRSGDSGREEVSQFLRKRKSVTTGISAYSEKFEVWRILTKSGNGIS